MSFSVSQDVQITRMKEKCIAYENEVMRLRSIHEHESNKLKNRIKNLEKLIKSADFLVDYLFEYTVDLKSKFMEVLLALDESVSYRFEMKEIPFKMTLTKRLFEEEEMADFIKGRRVFESIGTKIDELYESSFEDENQALNRLSSKLSGKNDFAMNGSPSDGLSSKSFKKDVEVRMETFTTEEEIVEWNEEVETTQEFNGGNAFVKKIKESGKIEDFVNFIQGQKKESSTTIINSSSNESQPQVSNYEYVTKIQETVEDVKELSESVSENKIKIQEEIDNLTLIVKNSKLEKQKNEEQLRISIQLKDEKMRIVQDLQKERLEISKEIEVFQKDIQDSDKDLTSEIERLNRARDNIANLERNLEKKMNKINRITEDIKTVEDAISEKDKRIAELDEEEKKLKIDLKDADYDFKQAAKDLKLKDKELGKIKKRIEDEREREEELKKQFDDIMEEKDRIGKDFDEAKNAVRDLERDIGIQDAILNQQRLNLDELDDKEERLKERLNKVIVEIKRISNKKGNTRGSPRKQEGRCNQSGVNVEKVFDELQEKMINFEGFVDNLVEEITELKSLRASDQNRVKDIAGNHMDAKLCHTKKKIKISFESIKKIIQLDFDGFNNLTDFLESLNSDELNQKLEEFKQRLSNLKIYFEELMMNAKDQRRNQETILSTNNEVIVQIESSLSELSELKKFDSKFEESFESITRISEQISRRAETARTGVKNFDSKLDFLKSNLEAIQANIELLEGTNKEYQEYIDNLEKSIDSYNEEIQEKLQEEKDLVFKLNDLQKSILYKRQEVTEILIKIGKTDGKKEILNKQISTKKTILGEENSFLADLEKTLLQKTKEFEALNAQKQEDVFSTFKDAIIDMQFNEKSNLLSMLLTLVDINFSSMGFKGSSLNTSYMDPSMSTVSARVQEHHTTEINQKLFSEFKDLLLQNTIISKETSEIVKTNFEKILSEGKYNFKRIISNFVTCDDTIVSTQGEYPKEKEELEAKQWRNTLKYIANLVSYMMKTSSFFINIYAYFIKDILRDITKKTKIKNLGLSFSEEIFKRHREIIDLVKSFEEQDGRDIVKLSDFIKVVSEYGKLELQSQNLYLKKLRTVFKDEADDSKMDKKNA